MNTRLTIHCIGVLLSVIQLLTASGHSAESTTVNKDSSRILALVDEIPQPQNLNKQSDSFTPPPSLSYGNNYYPNMRPGRQLLNAVNSFSPASLLSLASAASNTNYGYSMNDLMPEHYGETAQASGGGWGPGPGHIGGGFGFKDGYHIIKEEPIVNYSAVGLLGFLALLSLIQNVLRQMTTTTAKPAAGGRRKKRSNDGENDDSQSRAMELNRVTTLILPLLTAVAHTRDGLVPAFCTHREICNANALLSKNLGPQGRSLGSIITDAVSNLLIKDMKQSSKHLEAKIIRFAGKAGRNGENCKDLFETCPQLHHLPAYSIPMSMLENVEYKDEQVTDLQ